MEPNTGAVDTADGWYPYTEKDGLLEVRKAISEEEMDEYGEWVEI